MITFADWLEFWALHEAFLAVGTAIVEAVHDLPYMGP